MLVYFHPDIHFSTMAGSIYMEHILDLYKHPHNFGTLDMPTARYRAFNPLCGDDVTIGIVTDGGIVTDVKWEGRGCAISMASASLVTDLMKGKPLEGVMAVDKEEVLNLLGVPVGPVRLKCALLSLEGVHNCVRLAMAH